MKQITQIISLVFHPIFMPLAGIYILINAGIMETSFPAEYQRTLYLIVSLFSILLPLSFLPLLYFWKVIKSFEVNHRKERYVPLMFTSASLVFLNIMLGRVFHVTIINAYTFSIAAVSVLILFTNFILKISLHATALGGISGLILFLGLHYHANLFLLLVIFILISGIVGSSRLFLNAHVPKEIFIGYLLGLGSVYGIMFLLLK